MHYARAFVVAASFTCGARRRVPLATTSISHNFMTMSQYTRSDDETNTTIEELLQRAQVVRQDICGDETVAPSFIQQHQQLAIPYSSYEMKIDEGRLKLPKKSTSSVKRGFCNWLIPNRIMIGQYPGMTPELTGCSAKESQIHIQNMVQVANINQFCCLQTEVPAQDYDSEWEASGGEVYLDSFSRREFPRPFTRYGPLAQTFSESTLTFVHSPIEDLGTPSCNNSLLCLLSNLLEHLESDSSNTIYLHCWGGRGRAGLIGGLLGSLLFPELTSQQILAWVQGGYDTRAGAKAMHLGLRKSPQTEQQRQFVQEFVALVTEAKGKL